MDNIGDQELADRLELSNCDNCKGSGIADEEAPCDCIDGKRKSFNNWMDGLRDE